MEPALGRYLAFVYRRAYWVPQGDEGWLRRMELLLCRRPMYRRLPERIIKEEGLCGWYDRVEGATLRVAVPDVVRRLYTGTVISLGPDGKRRQEAVCFSFACCPHQPHPDSPRASMGSPRWQAGELVPCPRGLVDGRWWLPFPRGKVHDRFWTYKRLFEKASTFYLRTSDWAEAPLLCEDERLPRWKTWPQVARGI